MRALLVGCVLSLVFAGFQSPAVAAEPAGVREIERLVFEGVESGTVSDIRDALAIDFEVALAAHPDASLSGCLRAVETATLLGYHHSGFRDAKVTAAYDEQQERIVVRVAEGERHLCGDVNITGAEHADAAALVKAISQPAELKTPWVNDRPAPFDDSTMREIRKRLKDAFAAQGFFSPAFGVRIVAEPGEKAATLEVAISEEGPRAEIGEITLAGNERDSDDDILNYLELRPGQPYDSGLAKRLKACLDESGRFLGATIDRAGAKRIFEEGREIVPLHLELREYEHAPPLNGVFSAEQEALLKLREWAGRWSRGETEYDLVFEGSFGLAAMAQLCAEMDMPMPPVEQMGIERVEVKTVIAPHRGQVIAVRLLGAGGKVLFDETAVLHPDRLTIVAPERKARLELPFVGSNQTTLSLELRPADQTDEKGRRFNFMAGITLRGKKDKKNGPLCVEAKIAPTAMLWFLEGDDVECTREGSAWNLQREGIVARLEAESGRLMELRGHTESENEDEDCSDCTLIFRTAQGAFDRETQQFEKQLAAATAYDSSTPWKSLLKWTLDEWVFALGQGEAPAKQQAAWKAVGKLVSGWSPPAPTALVHFFDADDSDDDSWFELPWENQAWDLVDLQQPRSAARRNAAAAVLPIYRRLVPGEGWLWPAGRDFLLLLGSGEAIPLVSLEQAAISERVGPLGALTIACLKPSATATRVGQERLTLEAFRRDYQPLLSGDSWLSKWLLSLAEAARSLDEAELRAMIAAVCHDEQARIGAQVVARAIKQSADKPVAELVSTLLDSMWDSGISTAIASQLKKRTPAPEVATRIKPSTTDLPMSLKEELEKNAASPAKATPELPGSLFPDRPKASGPGEDNK